MKKTFSLWPLFMLVPVLGWAQADMPPAGERTSPPASVSALNYPGTAGKYNSTLEQLRDKLTLTPEQQALWHAYEGRVDAYTGQHQRERPVMPSPEEAAPLQVGRLVQNLQNRLAALEDIEQAAKQLYASLNAEQQKTANQLLLTTVPTFSAPANGGSPADSRRSSERSGREGPRGGGPGGGMGGGVGGGMSGRGGF